MVIKLTKRRLLARFCEMRVKHAHIMYRVFGLKLLARWLRKERLSRSGCRTMPTTVKWIKLKSKSKLLGFFGLRHSGEHQDQSRPKQHHMLSRLAISQCRGMYTGGLSSQSALIDLQSDTVRFLKSRSLKEVFAKGGTFALETKSVRQKSIR